MAKAQAKVVTPAQVAPVTPAPAQVVAVAVAPATPSPSAKKLRYVPARFSRAQVVTLQVATNPKQPRGKSYARFALHRSGYTVEQYVAASVAAGNKAALAHDDLRWDAAHGFITVE